MSIRARTFAAAAWAPLAVWTELTRLLPDAAWLGGISITDSTVTIDGTAQSAEGLIAIIDGSALFESVAFTGPVTKQPGGGLDRFSITFSLSKGNAVVGLAGPTWPRKWRVATGDGCGQARRFSSLRTSKWMISHSS